MNTSIRSLLLSGTVVAAGCHFWYPPDVPDPIPEPSAETTGGASVRDDGAVPDDRSAPAPVSSETSKYYKSCSIFNGQVSSCGLLYQGSAVIDRGGTFYECSFINGQIMSCSGSPHQGRVIAEQPGGTYHECDVMNGRVFACDIWFQGETVVYTDR